MKSANISLIIALTVLSLYPFQVLNAQDDTNRLIKEYKQADSNEKRLRFLDTLTTKMVRNRHPERFAYLDSAIALAKEHGDYDMAAKKTRFVIQNYIFKGDQDSALNLINSALVDSQQFKSPASSAHLILKRGAVYFDRNQFENASKDYVKASTLFHQSGDTIYEADAWYFNGQVNAAWKRFVPAVESFTKAYPLYEAKADSAYLIHTLNELASLYGMNTLYDKAIKDRLKIDALARSRGAVKERAINLINLTDNYFNQNALGKTRQTLDTLRSILSNIPESDPDYAIINYFAHIKESRYAFERKQIPEAEKHLQLAKEWVEKLRAPDYYQTEIDLASSRLYQLKGQRKEAIKSAKRVLNGKVNNPKTKMIAEHMLATLLEEHKPAEANLHLKNYLQIKDSIFNVTKSNAFLFYQSQFETERKENEIERQQQRIVILEKDKLLESNRRKLLWMGLALSLVLGGGTVIWVIQKNKRKREALFRKLEQNKRALEGFTAELLERSREKEILTHELESLKEAFGEKEELGVLLDLASSKILTHDDWNEFKEKFLTVHPHFFIQMQNKGIRLTKSEERLLALEKLSMKTDEIANMLGVSSSSIIKSRYRLRKKLESPKDVSLLDFVESLPAN
ncbi:hypothetical protein FUAX_20550 [Fulvitalea axinellae]|uniref:HTH luxR-type domain-containing protein n=1 Tax=Fulvitalea axinellae TaxID=1182444 RepID=A0AAU9D134_9BACT|nr:hypothetical protein FUAX_20550 [Fulvitalea axinellae]